ncbi:proline-rich protein 3 isoform X2 [Mus musculus]|nr:proline-rich protein 3 isoform X2 [Mus musculus]
MHGAASGRRAWEARADSVTGATKWQSREGGRVSPPPGAPGSCHSPGGGRATGRGHAPPRGRLERMAPGGRAGTALAARWTGCPVDWPAATGLAIAAAAMPKRKKQDQPPPLPQQQQHLALSERDEPGDEEDERPMGPPSLLGPPPMANGKPGDPKSECQHKFLTCGRIRSSWPASPAIANLRPASLGYMRPYLSAIGGL